MRTAKVAKVHPEAHAVDLVFLDNGARVPMVQVLALGASSNTGTVDLPEPTAPAKEGDVTPTKDRDIYALVGQVGRSPIVLGFFYPQVAQPLFKDRPNFRVNRHASDVYSTLDDGGNFEMHFPNGSYLRIAEDPEHEDLSGQDFDQKWAQSRNTTKHLNVRLAMMKDGVQKFALTIDPDGNVAITAAGTITSTAPQWNHTGPVQITGTLHVTDNVQIDKTMTATTDAIGGGKSLKNHTHPDPQGGSTSPPS